ncbi:MAG: sn-glycerol-1-phosphate dehydrogenase [Bacillota bacterium]
MGRDDGEMRKDDPELTSSLARLLSGEGSGPIELECPCGRRHVVPIEALVNRAGALEQVAGFLERRGVRQVWVIADENTDAAAGSRLRQLLVRAGVRVASSVLPAVPAVHPDEKALGRLAFDLRSNASFIVAAGAGTITDLARFFASRLGRPFIAVPTAPSVDGFTSSVAAMVAGGVRASYPAVPPVAVFADPEVYAAAPRRLIASGWAELAGKWTALADWALAAVLNGEYRCSLATKLTEEAAALIRERRDGSPSTAAQNDSPCPAWHEPGRVQRLMDGLLKVGVAMLMVGSSRPASGAEHHLAHYWEMRALAEGAVEPSLHGERVGVASVEVLRLYHRLLASDPGAWPGPVSPSPQEHEGAVRRRFGRLADRLVAEQRTWPDGPWRLFGRSRAELSRRRHFIRSRWETIVRTVGPYLPEPENVAEHLAQAGAPASVVALPEVAQPVEACLVAARELRPRYTVLSLATEAGMLAC